MAWEWLTPEYERAQREGYERIRAKHPALVTVPFECYAGWHGIIQEYFDEVDRLLAEHPGSTYELLQVKEKFAGLRLYSRASDDIHEAVLAAYDRAARLSEVTCEVCGRPGALRNRRGAYMTRCEEHADGSVPTDPGLWKER